MTCVVQKDGFAVRRPYIPGFPCLTKGIPVGMYRIKSVRGSMSLIVAGHAYPFRTKGLDRRRWALLLASSFEMGTTGIHQRWKSTTRFRKVSCRPQTAPGITTTTTTTVVVGTRSSMHDDTLVLGSFAGPHGMPDRRKGITRITPRVDHDGFG